ncbi:MAG: DNA alkylation repair protein [Bacteroidales bacterium]|nr:DNA alkylation repair protein [Bacteroidales bacterium]
MKTTDIQSIEKIFRAHSNSASAEKMAAYMKNKFPFLGISSPERAEIYKIIFDQFGAPSLTEFEAIVNLFWKMPEREFHYFAMHIIEKHKRKLAPSHLEFILDLIVKNSWWDSIDWLAPHFVGKILKDFPELREEYVPQWIASDNIWINRTAILFQLKYKKDTDFNLLIEIIESLKHHKEFFVKKAIGWVLREYSKTNPEAVLQYIEQAQLQALSEKEGLKHIQKQLNK